MKVEDLHIDQRVKELIMGQGIETLYPPQEDAAPKALEGENLVLAIPTASGKSLVAYLSAVTRALMGQKTLYIVPLRALAMEKYDDLKEFETLGIKVALSVGDYDKSDEELMLYDIIVATSEKADSLLRHKSHWLRSIELIVADEVHLIHDPNRGPTLEVLLARFLLMKPDAQIIALSATIQNSIELADWLGAAHITSDWRPVDLRYGTLLKGELAFINGEKRKFTASKNIRDAVMDTVKDNGQALIFVNTRRSTQSMARDLAKCMEEHVDREELEKLANSIEHSAESTHLSRELVSCVKKGTAFHNAGLTNAQRKLVERGFKAGYIKCITATPTLAAGINLPARRVIVRDLYRYDANYGNTPIPVLEVKQMCGRAGRPGYDPYGEAILRVRNSGERDMVMEHYILGEPERVYSKLGTEPALRTHTLALLATGAVSTRQDILDFIDHTFFSYQGDVYTIESVIDKVLEFLVKEEMVEGQDPYTATIFGKRTSDLYIDPLSSVMLRDALLECERKSITDIGILHAVCSTPDMLQLYLRKKDYEWLEIKASKRLSDFLLEPPRSYGGVDYEFFLSSLKTASLLSDWMNEMSEDELTIKYNVGPGDVRGRVELADWLLYSMTQLGRLFLPTAVKDIRLVQTRVRSGIREELLELVAMEQIGRRRARTLFNRNIRSPRDLKAMSIEELAHLPGFGKVLAERILGQVH